MKTKSILFIVFCLLFLVPCIVSAAVVINEVLYDPDGMDTGKEYIRLYNPEGFAINLDGYELNATSGDYYVFQSFSLKPESFVIVHWRKEGVDTQTDLYTGTDGFDANMGDTKGWMALFNSNSHNKDTIIDYLEYGETGRTWESTAAKAGIWTTGDYIPDVEAGYAIKLKVDGQDNNSSNDWDKSTPSISESEETAPQDDETTAEQSSSGTESQSLTANAGQDIIGFVGDEINFSGSSTSADPKDLIFWWNLGDGQTTEGQNASHSYSYPGTYIVVLVVSDGRQSGQDMLTVEIYPKSITTNEFIPNPEGKDEEEEWIEIFNYSNQPVDISDWQLDDQEGGSEPFVFPENTLIAPYNYLVLSRKITKIALNNDIDSVRLLLPQGVIYQEITYEKAPEGQSSSRGPDGFVWGMPTPGLPNIIGTKDQNITYNQPPETLTTNYPPENYAWYYKNDLETEIQGGWAYLSPHQKDSGGGDLPPHQGDLGSEDSPPENEEQELNQREDYNLANIEQTAKKGNLKLIFTIIAIIAIAFVAGLGLVKLKKRNKSDTNYE